MINPRLAAWIEKRYPHRLYTHSFLVTGAIAVLTLRIEYFSGHLLAAIALPLGHLLATFSDCFTKQGLQLFFPYPAWCISVSNPRRRLKTGGAGELWVLGMAIALLANQLILVILAGMARLFPGVVGFLLVIILRTGNRLLPGIDQQGAIRQLRQRLL